MTVTSTKGAVDARLPLGLAIASQTCSMLPVFLVGALSPYLMRDLGFDALDLGISVALFYFASALGSIFLSGHADRLAVWSIVRAALLALVLATVGIASIGSGVIVIGGMLFVCGLANGCVHPTTNVVIAKYVSPGRQGLAYGLKQSAVPAATLLGGLTVPLLAETIGWRAAFAGAALLTLALLLLTPRRDRTGRHARSAAPKIAIPLRRDILILLAVMSGAGAAACNAMAAFLVPSIVAQGFAPTAAGLALAAGSVTAIVVRVSLGAATDRWRLPNLRIAAGLFLAGAASYLMLATSGAFPVIVFATLVTFGLGWGWSGLTLVAIARVNAGAVGAATGINQGGVFVGAMIGPAGFGLMVDRWGYGPAWTAAAVVAILAAMLALIASRSLAHHAKRTA